MTAGFTTPDTARAYLSASATVPDADLDLAEAALALAVATRPAPVEALAAYRQHIARLHDDVAKALTTAGDGLDARLSALRGVLHHSYGYRGDTQSYDDLQNANILDVTERRRGLPVALGILYMTLAARQGWSLHGLNFPGHFLLRLDEGRERRIIDPFREGAELHAPDLRALLKSLAGDRAELAHNYYEPVRRRDVLIRLQNNLKKRLIDLERYDEALVVLDSMVLLAPDDPRPLFDRGVLCAKLGQPAAARLALNDYIARAPTAKDRAQARAILKMIDRDRPPLK